MTSLPSSARTLALRWVTAHLSFKTLATLSFSITTSKTSRGHQESRTVLANIRRMLGYLLATNAGEALTMLGALLFSGSQLAYSYSNSLD